MEHLNTNELFSIAIMLDLPDLLSLCKSSNRINQLICQRNDIWFYKLNKEFPNFELYKTPKFTYELNLLKLQLNYEHSIEQLYNTNILYLDNNNLSELPKEIGNLINLEILYLNMNNVTELPKEIGNLTNLKYLNLNDNNLTELPKELGNLNKLNYLSVYNNLIELPKEVENIKGLTVYR